MKLLQLLERGKVAVERARVRGATDAGKVRGLIIGPGVSNGAPGRGGITEGVGKVSELVGNAIRLEIGNVVAGEVNAPFLEVCANNFGVVMLILIAFVCAEWKGEKERGQQARKQDGKR